jgi:spermidine synthase
VVRAALSGVFLLSGAAGLGYQVVWARMFGAGFGHEMAGVLAVVSAFFAGMAIGGAALDRSVSRSPSPARWYVGLELVIAGWAVLSAFAIPAANTFAHAWLGVAPGALRHWGTAFAVPLALLLPATAAMGATLPALDRIVAPLVPSRRAIGGLYAANTAGAAIGTLASAHVLVPRLGLRGTLLLFATLNVACALVIVWLSPALRSDRAAPPSAPATGLSSRRIAVTVFATGLLGIGYEALGVRVLCQALENSVYSFAGVLAVYLFGTALGAAIYQRTLSARTPERIQILLLVGLSTSCALGLWPLSQVGPIYAAARGALGDEPLAVALAESLTAAAVFVLPTLWMGATFSHLVQCARGERGGAGRASALNSVGGALAPPLFGVLLAPAIGMRLSLVAVVGGFLLLLPPRRGAAWAALPIALLMLVPGEMPGPHLLPDERLLARREGVMAVVSVVEDARGSRRLRVNSRFEMGGTDAGAAERLQAHIPLLLHPRPQRALFLGVASGVTVGATLAHPDLHSDAVELVPEVLELLPYFEPENGAPQRAGAIRLFAADARRFVRASGEHYDVVVADLFHPGQDGAGTLYTREHFQGIRARLAPGGLFCQWLPLHQLDLATLGIVVAAFLDVFPEPHAFVAGAGLNPALGLIGRVGSGAIAVDSWQRRVEPLLAKSLARSGLTDLESLLGLLVVEPAGLRALARGAEPSTDDRPSVIYRAPLFTVRRDGRSWGRLDELLRRGPPDVRGLVPAADTAILARVAERRRAFVLYQDALVAAAEGRGADAFATLWRSFEASPGFEPAVDHAVEILRTQGPSDPGRALRLLQRLLSARPDREDARALRDALAARGTATERPALPGVGGASPPQ